MPGSNMEGSIWGVSISREATSVAGLGQSASGSRSSGRRPRPERDSMDSITFFLPFLFCNNTLLGRCGLFIAHTLLASLEKECSEDLDHVVPDALLVAKLPERRW